MASTISAQGKAITDLERWQDKQNGSLQRIEGKVDKLQFWMMTAAAGGMFATLLAAAGWLLKK
jgi:hypothetical protein